MDARNPKASEVIKNCIVVEIMGSNLEPKNTDVIILCGGKGERLQSLVSDKPKPLADVNGKPFLDFLIDHAASFGFLRFILCTGYLGKQVEKYSTKKNGVRILISHEETPLGTGGAIKNASALIENNPFMVLNGDSYCPMDFRDFVDDYSRKNARYEMVLTQPNDRKDVGLVTLNPRMEVTSPTGTLPNAGIYLFDRDILNRIPNRPCSLEHDILPTLIGNGFFGYLTKEDCFDIGTPERYLSFIMKHGN